MFEASNLQWNRRKRMHFLKDKDNPWIQFLAEKYESVIENNHRKRQNELVRELFEKAKMLKQELAFYKREASQQNIEKVISQRRREKQKIRQGLQSKWRECAQSFKEMQEDEKALLNQQKQSIFDIQNIQNKIKEFQAHIQRIKTRLSKLEEATHDNFLTQINHSYLSPYSKLQSSPQRSQNINQSKRKLLAQSQQSLFSSKYKILHPNSNIQNSTQNIFSLQSRCRQLRVKANDPNSNSLNYQKFQKYHNKHTNSDSQNSRLSAFLNDKQVRLKIFKLLRKQV